MWRHRHAWYTTSVPIHGEYSKRDCPRDKYSPKQGEVLREPGYLAICSKDDCFQLGIDPVRRLRVVEIEV